MLNTSIKSTEEALSRLNLSALKSIHFQRVHNEIARRNFRTYPQSLHQDYTELSAQIIFYIIEQVRDIVDVLDSCQKLNPTIPSVFLAYILVHTSHFCHNRIGKYSVHNNKRTN